MLMIVAYPRKEVDSFYAALLREANIEERGTGVRPIEMCGEGSWKQDA